MACVVAVGASACLPRERTNAACRWTGDTTVLAPPGDPARRAHLLTDVRLAQDLGIRHADSAIGRPPPSMARWDSARRVCTDASLETAARRHDVASASLKTLARAREPWVDLVLVFLPMAALFATASRIAARRFVAGYAPGERRTTVARLALSAPFAAALALAVTQLWGVMVESARLRNGHISYRAFELPATRHPWLGEGIAIAVFAAAAATVVGRHDTEARRESCPS